MADFFNHNPLHFVTTSRRIQITAPARLHMGFIDMSGALGRHFGSIGVGLNEISTSIQLSFAANTEVSGAGAERALPCLQKLCARLGVPATLHLEIATAIPDHIGLGSGTQLALAIGMAISEFYDLKLTVRDIACLSERGTRSGIGIGVFEQGGLVVDGGRGTLTNTPPLLSRLSLPEAWRFILVFDQRGQGLHGEQELAAFRALPAFPRRRAEQLSYLLLMQALPSVVEQDLPAFGAVISELQTAVGEHFAPVQGGVFTSPTVAQAMQWLANQGAVGIGQTSWGPTGFCLVDNQHQAEQLLQGLQALALPQLYFQIASARNQGAAISCST